MSEAVLKRNITALHENSKMLLSKIDELREQLVHSNAQVAQLSADVLQLRTQVMISATNVGGGPTSGNNR